MRDDAKGSDGDEAASVALPARLMKKQAMAQNDDNRCVRMLHLSDCSPKEQDIQEAASPLRI
ncbi:hypothetical protein sS8_5054 [Methylocaldum marinum]|uniref:Uncharacterized protein n=1 Tax=Methylocaldum marinum TaxID=1432792 RepID=A0A250KZD6_9GAMM|nr:hypothetical protein sS8_5054 [Methylocaldum marinum]